MSADQNDSNFIFSQETIDSLVALGNVLERIYRRMKNEGYDIIDGRIIHLETGKEYEAQKAQYYKGN
jgi:hypothetical protein